MRLLFLSELLGVTFCTTSNFYSLLSVEPNCSSLSIREAFKTQLWSQAHQGHYNDLRTAVEVLSNDTLRQQYDEEGERFVVPNFDFNDMSKHPEGVFLHNPEVMGLTTAEFRFLTQQVGETWLVYFYSPEHCPDCHDQWREVGTLLSSSVNVGAVDCVAQPGACAGVSHVPTVRALHQQYYSQFEENAPEPQSVRTFFYAALDQYGLGVINITSKEQLGVDLPMLVGLCSFNETECEPFKNVLRSLALELHGVARVGSLNCKAHKAVCALLSGEGAVELRLIRKKGVELIPMPTTVTDLGQTLEATQSLLLPKPLHVHEASLLVSGLGRLDFLLLAARLHPAGILVEETDDFSQYTEEEMMQLQDQEIPVRVSYQRVNPNDGSEVTESYWGLDFSVEQMAYFALSTHRLPFTAVHSVEELQAATRPGSVLLLYKPFSAEGVLVRSWLAQAASQLKGLCNLFLVDCATHGPLCNSVTGHLPSLSVAGTAVWPLTNGSQVVAQVLTLLEATNSQVPHVESVRQFPEAPKPAHHEAVDNKEAPVVAEEDKQLSGLLSVSSTEELWQHVKAPPLFVSLWAKDCPLCHSALSNLARASKQINVPAVRVDCDKLPETCKETGYDGRPLTILYPAQGSPSLLLGNLSSSLLVGWFNQSVPGRHIQADSSVLQLLLEEKTPFLLWFDTECRTAACQQTKLDIQDAVAKLQVQLEPIHVYHFDCFADLAACNTAGATSPPSLRLHSPREDGSWDVKDLGPGALAALQNHREDPSPDQAVDEAEETVDLDESPKRPAANPKPASPHHHHHHASSAAHSAATSSHPDSSREPKHPASSSSSFSSSSHTAATPPQRDTRDTRASSVPPHRDTHSDPRTSSSVPLHNSPGFSRDAPHPSAANPHKPAPATHKTTSAQHHRAANEPADVQTILTESEFAVSDATVSLLTKRLLTLCEETGTAAIPELKDASAAHMDLAVDSVRGSLARQLQELFKADSPSTTATTTTTTRHERASERPREEPRARDSSSQHLPRREDLQRAKEEPPAREQPRNNRDEQNHHGEQQRKSDEGERKVGESQYREELRRRLELRKQQEEARKTEELRAREEAKRPVEQPKPREQPPPVADIPKPPQQPTTTRPQADQSRDGGYNVDVQDEEEYEDQSERKGKGNRKGKKGKGAGRGKGGKRGSKGKQNRNRDSEDAQRQEEPPRQAAPPRNPERKPEMKDFYNTPPVNDGLRDAPRPGAQGSNDRMQQGGQELPRNPRRDEGPTQRREDRVPNTRNDDQARGGQRELLSENKAPAWDAPRTDTRNWAQGSQDRGAPTRGAPSAQDSNYPKDQRGYPPQEESRSYPKPDTPQGDRYPRQNPQDAQRDYPRTGPQGSQEDSRGYPRNVQQDAPPQDARGAYPDTRRNDQKESFQEPRYPRQDSHEARGSRDGPQDGQAGRQPPRDAWESQSNGSRDPTRNVPQDKYPRNPPHDEGYPRTTPPQDNSQYPRNTPPDNNQYPRNTPQDNNQYPRNTPPDNSQAYPRTSPQDNQGYPRPGSQESHNYPRDPQAPQAPQDYPRTAPKDNQGNNYPQNNQGGYPPNQGYPPQNNQGGYPPQNNQNYPRNPPQDRDQDRSAQGYPPQDNQGYPRSPQDNQNYPRNAQDNQGYPRSGSDSQGSTRQGGYPSPQGYPPSQQGYPPQDSYPRQQDSWNYPNKGEPQQGSSQGSENRPPAKKSPFAQGFDEAPAPAAPRSPPPQDSWANNQRQAVSPEQDKRRKYQQLQEKQKQRQQGGGAYEYEYDDTPEPSQQEIADAKAKLGGEAGIAKIRERMEDYMRKVGGQIGLEKRMKDLGQDVVQAEIKALMGGVGGGGGGGGGVNRPRVQYD